MGKPELLPKEQILATVKGDCWEAPGILEQVPGVYTFTDRRIIFQGNGLIEKLRLNFEIPYEQIWYIESYLVVFFPTGIRVWTKSRKQYRLSVPRRKKYMDLINSHLG